MDTPASDVVVGTRYIYTLALALVGLALATSAIPFLLLRFLKRRWLAGKLSGCLVCRSEPRSRRLSGATQALRSACTEVTRIVLCACCAALALALVSRSAKRLQTTAQAR